LDTWFVASTIRGKERVAESNLGNQSIRNFLPLRRKSFRKGRKCVVRLAPLFPGYIFVAPGSERDKCRAINGTLGVKRLICADERPVPLPAGFVERLADELRPDGSISHAPQLRPGDTVEISHGPLACSIGELLTIDDRGRVALLVKFLSSYVSVKTHIEFLLPA
jgi:transcription antitermination factor NusG